MSYHWKNAGRNVHQSTGKCQYNLFVMTMIQYDHIYMFGLVGGEVCKIYRLRL